eukprot:CAMPEP_0175774520 /NCGR_PEP_ID=MMETSP0097-20121207/73647_1 /TAXON_ID=311494 /ORGANISM="Alexandrium monilatum, Strain CCMP3105" /LENGTH=61 /DNA_ID=CAMNT_0017084987 /DNA_START=1 /DNA_END=183 /DNA_ORIENTATION=+
MAMSSESFVFCSRFTTSTLRSGTHRKDLGGAERFKLGGPALCSGIPGHAEVQGQGGGERTH